MLQRSPYRIVVTSMIHENEVCMQYDSIKLQTMKSLLFNIYILFFQEVLVLEEGFSCYAFANLLYSG